jgi:hypothetical protein
MQGTVLVVLLIGFALIVIGAAGLMFTDKKENDYY